MLVVDSVAGRFRRLAWTILQFLAYATLGLCGVGLAIGLICFVCLSRRAFGELLGAPSRPAYQMDDLVRAHTSIFKTMNPSSVYMSPQVLAAAVGDVPVSGANLFAHEQGAWIDTVTTSETLVRRRTRFNRLVAPAPPPSTPEDVIRGGPRWCPSTGVAQLGIRTSQRVHPNELLLEIEPVVGGSRLPQTAFVELWVRISDPRQSKALDKAIEGVYFESPNPSKSLLGFHNFGMRRDYVRIAAFAAPASLGRVGGNESQVASDRLRRVKLPVNLAELVLDTDSFVIRATIDGPLFCFVRAELRAAVSDLPPIGS